MKAAANTPAGPPIKRSVPGLQITGTVVNFRLRRTYQDSGPRVHDGSRQAPILPLPKG